MGVHEAAQGPGVQDTEWCKVLPNLDIVPSKPAHQAAIDATQVWPELEEQNEIAENLLLDAREGLQEKVNNTYHEEVNNLSDDEELSDIDDGDESVQFPWYRRRRYHDIGAIPAICRQYDALG